MVAIYKYSIETFFVLFVKQRRINFSVTLLINQINREGAFLLVVVKVYILGDLNLFHSLTLL